MIAVAKKKTTKKKVAKKPEGKPVNDCPFVVCGGKAKLHINPWGKYVECTKCGAAGPALAVSDTDNMAINAWNKLK